MSLGQHVEMQMSPFRSCDDQANGYRRPQKLLCKAPRGRGQQRGTRAYHTTRMGQRKMANQAHPSPLCLSRSPPIHPPSFSGVMDTHSLYPLVRAETNLSGVGKQAAGDIIRVGRLHATTWERQELVAFVRHRTDILLCHNHNGCASIDGHLTDSHDRGVVVAEVRK